MKLYEIRDEILLLEEIDADTPDMAEAIKNSMDDLEMELEEKVDNIIKLMKSIDTDIDVIKGEINRLKNRVNIFNNRKQALKSYVVSTMESIGKKKIETPLYTVSTVKGRDSVIIDNASELPGDYVKVEVIEKPDKTAILKAIKSGEQLTGAHIEVGAPTLRVK